MTTPRNRSLTTGPALEKGYQFVSWLTPAVEKFPRSHKLTLGDRIYQGALNVLDGLVEATDNHHTTPVPLQERLGMGLKKMRFLLRPHRDSGERTPAAHRVCRPVSEQGGGPIFDRKRPLLRQVPPMLRILQCLGLAFNKTSNTRRIFQEKVNSCKANEHRL